MVKGELKKMKECSRSLMVNVQLTQKEHERVRGKLREKVVLTTGSREEPKARKRGGGGQSREAGRSDESPAVLQFCARMYL